MATLNVKIKDLWDDLCYECFHKRDSVFISVDGFNQSGKTDFILEWMNQSYDLGYFKRFGLNQQITGQDFEYDFIHDLESLFNRVGSLKKPYWYFLDELGKTAPRGTPWNKMNLALIDKLEVKRKDKLNLIGASIGDVDRRILSPNYLDVHITKTTLTSAKVTHLKKKWTIHLSDIPKTKIKFSEFTVTKFTLRSEGSGGYESPMMERFRRYSEGIKQSEIWQNREQKKREIIKLYKMIREDVTHTALEVSSGESVTK